MTVDAFDKSQAVIGRPSHH